MTTTILWLAAAAPSPSPSGVDIAPSQGGSPGFPGFVATFLLACALVALFLSLTHQLRKVNRSAARQAPDAEQTAGPADTGAAGPDLEVDGGTGPASGTGPRDPGPGSGS